LSSTVPGRSQEAFDAVRRQAFVQDILAELSGRPDDLLSFDDVRQQLRLSEPGRDVSLEEIPLNRIVGSVGRYRDFTRAFLPRAPIDRERWARIDQLRALPPIDVFKVGDIYFVSDGNHRVSVARARKQKTILARVVEVPTRVPINSNTSPDDLILKSGYAQFLEQTSLDRTCPAQHIELTRPGGYRSLLQHIEIHQFYMGLRSRRYPSLSQAATNWYHKVYSPVVERIQASGTLRHFPGRTEADLYLWIAEHRAALQMHYSIGEQAQEAVADFARAHYAPPPLRWLQRLLHRLFPRLYRRQPKMPAPHEKADDR